MPQAQIDNTCTFITIIIYFNSLHTNTDGLLTLKNVSFEIGKYESKAQI